MLKIKKSLFFLLSILVLAAILRFYHLGTIPPSLYSDEINQGYNAYSLMLTGRDEHGVFLPVSLRSFGDWKPPFPAYLMVPAIFLFGLNEFSVRLPGALLGLLTVILIFKLVKSLFGTFYSVDKIALISSFILAVSPWHILQSRASMLVNIGLFFYLAALVLFLKGLKNKIALLLSSIFFVLSVYSYYGMRLLVPLTIILILVNFRYELKSSLKHLLISGFLAVLLLLPLFLSFLENPDVIFGRAKTVSIFYDQGINLRQFELLTQDAFKISPLWSRFYHNKIFLYGKDFIRRFLSHFDGVYLFIKGDMANPFRIPGHGIFYLIDGLFLVSGFYFLLKYRLRYRSLIFSLLLLCIIPAALTFVTPASNRSFNSIVFFQIISAFGLLLFIELLKNKILLINLITIIYIFSLGYFLRQYFLVLPYHHAGWWSYQWKAAADKVLAERDRYENIFIVNQNEMVYVYLLFNFAYDPAKFQNTAERIYHADVSGFEHVQSFDKYYFFLDKKWIDIKNNLQKSSLYIIPIEQWDDVNAGEYILYPDGKKALVIVKT